MPPGLVHLLIPPVVLLATGRFPLRTVLLLLPFSLLPDLDFFIPPHRALLHSVFLVLAAGLLARHWWARGERGKGDAAIVAAFYLGSHSLMDVFVGGVVPLWPVSDQNVFIDAYVLIDTATLQVYPTFQPGVEAGVPEVSPVYEAFEGIQAGIVSLILVTAGLMAWRRFRTVKREVVVVAPDR